MYKGKFLGRLPKLLDLWWTWSLVIRRAVLLGVEVTVSQAVRVQGVTCEVQQLLGEGTIRCVAMEGTEGLQTGAEVIIEDGPMYEQGCILLPHVASLGCGVRVSGEVFDLFPFFVVGVLHLISGAVLAFGGVYHSVFGPEVITSTFFEYRWSDRNAMTSILGIHLMNP